MAHHLESALPETSQVVQSTTHTPDGNTATSSYESDRLLDGTTAKYLTILYPLFDISDRVSHEDRDNNLLKALEEKEYSHLKDPKTDSDIIALMQLITTHSTTLLSQEYCREDSMECYLNSYYLDAEEVGEETRAEFLKLVGLCVERKKFKPLRNLGELSFVL